MTMTTARRMSEVQALMAKCPNMIFHRDTVVLRPHPKFIPKAVLKFSLKESAMLPIVFPSHTLYYGKKEITLARLTST